MVRVHVITVGGQVTLSFLNYSERPGKSLNLLTRWVQPVPEPFQHAHTITAPFSPPTSAGS